MKKLMGTCVALVLAVAGTVAGGSPAADALGARRTAMPATGTPVSATTWVRAATTSTWTLKDPFSREVVRPGDRDTDPYHIEHVYEVQYRLRWLGLLSTWPNGFYDRKTEAAVKAFQKRNRLAQTGTVNYATWQPLIKQTIRGRAVVPSQCKTGGWHACYDRRRHQLSLYHDGRMWNSWLVRGGSYYAQTRRGNFTVYWRDIDHVSTIYDSAPMPYSQFFYGGEALHGSRYMVDPFVGHSHGCVNMWVKDARQLWNLTATKRLHVHVYGAWS